MAAELIAHCEIPDSVFSVNPFMEVRLLDMIEENVQVKHPDEFIEFIEKFAKMVPMEKLSVFYLEAGKICYRRKDRMRYFQKACEITPSDTNKFYLYLELQKDPSIKKDALDKIRNLSVPIATCFFAEVALLEGKFADASILYKDAFDRGSGMAAYQLGKISEYEGRLKIAHDYYIEGCKRGDISSMVAIAEDNKEEKEKYAEQMCKIAHAQPGDNVEFLTRIQPGHCCCKGAPFRKL